MIYQSRKRIDSRMSDNDHMKGHDTGLVAHMRFSHIPLPILQSSELNKTHKEY